MKRLFSFFVLFGIAQNYIYSQSKFNIGLDIGPSINYLKGSKELDFKSIEYSRVGYVVGVNCEYKITANLYIKTGIGYEQKGAKYKDAPYYDMSTLTMIGKSTRQYQIDYLTIPLIVKLSTKGRNRFFINIGVYTGYLLKAISTQDAVAGYPALENDWMSSANKWDLGILSGAGYCRSLTDKLYLGCEIRDNMGLKQLWNIKGSYSKPNSIGLCFFIKYDL